MRRFTIVLLVVLGLAVCVASCGAPKPAPAPAPSYWAVNAKRRAQVDLILILAPPSPHVERLIFAVRSELATQFDVHVEQVGGEATAEEVGVLVTRARPAAVIVLDTPTAVVYGRWARAKSAPPPAILAMASFVDELRTVVPHSTGVSFEPPAVTTLADLRGLLSQPLRKAGVVYREGFEAHIALQRSRLAAERIELFAVQVPARPTPRSVALALRRIEAAHVDVLWVSNDNVLLSDALLVKAWFPYAERSSLPVVVGVPGLVGRRPHFGTYAAVPDLEGLGVQLADLVFELRDRHWNTSDQPVQPPTSIRTYLDVDHAERLGMDATGQASVDVLLRGDAK